MDAAAAHFARELDLRYNGQGYELRTPLDGLYAGRMTRDALAGARDAVRRAPRADPRPCRQGAPGRTGELSPARPRAGAEVPGARGSRRPPRAPAASAAIKGQRTIHFDGKTAIEATLYERDRLDVGAVIAGPAIVEQFDATTVIPPGWTARVDGLRNLILERA